MRIRKFAAAIAIAAAFALSACATSLNTRVTRYQAMPAPQGQTFFVVPEGRMAATGGLEFQRYAALVTQQLQARGYTPAASVQDASMIVQLGYGIDQGQVRVVSDPFGPYGGYGYPGYFGGSRFFYPRFGYWGSPFYYGWDDPFMYGRGIDSYVEYHSEVDLHIRGKGTNTPLFDGRAQARSETNRLDVVLPGLIEALFTGFPGRNGETVKITIPARAAAR
jgi:hypothetical protein